MGIKLDWQVESEQTRVRATEDPAARQARRRARNRLILLIIALASLVALVGALVLWRLDQVDSQYRQDLLDTVEIEVTALRIGDFANFMAIQRSASDAFLLEQSRAFEVYQELKRQHRVELPGTVIDAEIDGLRGRVVVEERIDGIPYHVVWYYWYYEDAGEENQGGWRRVPDDLTFWGEAREIHNGAVHLTYYDLDDRLAQALAPVLAGWWQRGCGLLGCDITPPRLHVDIVAARPQAVEWTGFNTWTLRITSPLVERARADRPIPPDMAQAIVEQLAVRLIRFSGGDLPPVGYSDAAWLQQELARWLAVQIVAGDDADVVPLTAVTQPQFVDALVAQYGPGAPATVLAILSPNTSVDDMLASVTGVPMPLLTVDQLNDLAWEPFFQWRLALEAELLSEPGTSGMLLTLYDLDNPLAAGEAQLRMENPSYRALPVPQVQTTTVVRDEQSQTFAYVEVTGVEAGNPVSSATYVWRLSGGTWKRVS